MQQLDKEVAALREHTYAPATKQNYKSQLRSYLEFCHTYNFQPVPASPENICRYIAYLARAKAFGTIQQYLSIIRLLHLNNNFANPLSSNHSVSSLMRAVKRVKGAEQNYKLTLSLNQIKALFKMLNMSSKPDLQLWAMISACFYGLLRIGSVTVPSAKQWDADRILKRSDIEFVPNGCILSFSHSKTIQFRERVFRAVLPLIPGDCCCPTTALRTLVNLSPDLPPAAPALSYRGVTGEIKVVTPAHARERLSRLFRQLGLSPDDYNTHSLRRSGATHLMLNNVPLETIRVLGDWKSDAIYRYLKPSADSKLTFVHGKFD